MGFDTGIEWCDHTFNPWWGCEKVDPGCKNCYAATFDHRLGGNHWGGKAPRKFFKDKHWNEPLKWDAQAKAEGRRHRVFCASMADVFEDRGDLREPRSRLFALINATPNLDWLLLTKRPDNFVMFLPWWADTLRAMCALCKDGVGDNGAPCRMCSTPWPNVWLGVTAADQAGADWRIPILAGTPAAVRFVSYEPALEYVNFTPWVNDSCSACGRVGGDECGCGLAFAHLRPIDWLIAGSESGHGARPASMTWYSRVRDVIAASSASTRTSFFLKQHVELDGRAQRKISLPVLDGRTWDEVPQ